MFIKSLFVKYLFIQIIFLSKLHMIANIMMMHIFHKLKYDLKGNMRQLLYYGKDA